jgi:cyclic pyranopterin phosphate synthase
LGKTQLWTLARSCSQAPASQCSGNRARQQAGADRLDGPAHAPADPEHICKPISVVGDIGEGRIEQYLPLSIVRARLSKRYTLEDIDYRTGGPARYVRVKETGGRLGFITPLTHNFCESCNRVRITCTGTLYMCLGQEDAADLRTPLRASESDEALHAAIEEAISRKPKGHDFVIDRRHRRPALARHMSVTGG